MSVRKHNSNSPSSASKPARGLLLLCAALLVSAGCDEGDKAPLPEVEGKDAPERPEIPTEVQTAQDAPQHSSQRFVGNVRAKQHVEIAPQMTGVIASIEVEEGDMVEAGQRLFRIAGSAVRLSVAQAQTGVSAAKLQLAEAEREAARTRKLAERGSVGQANLERAESGVEAAAAGVKQAKAAAAVARARTGELTVDAPISGVISAKNKSKGEVATMMPPTIILVIDDLSTIEARVRIPELKLREVDVDTPVTLYFPALDLTRSASVTRIGNSVDTRTRTIELIIEIDNPGMRIKAGMSVELTLGRAAPLSANAENAETAETAGAQGQAPEPEKTTAMVEKPAPKAG